MDSFNITVLNGDLVSTRRGLHVSKSKHKGVRFVNTFTAPKTPSPCRPSRSLKSKPRTMQDYTYTFVNTPPRKETRPRCSRSPRTRSTVSTPSPVPSSRKAITREESPSYLFENASPLSSLDPYPFDFLASSPVSPYSDLSPTLSDCFVDDAALYESGDLQSLLGRCRVRQASIESMNEVVTLAQSMRLMKNTSTWSTSFYLNAHTEIRQRLGIQLLQFPTPLFGENPGRDALFANVSGEGYGHQSNNTNLTLVNSIDKILRTASILYLEILAPTHHRIPECIALLGDLARSIILHLYEQELIQDSYFALDNIANTDHLRPIVIWVCTLVYAFNAYSRANMANPSMQLNLLPFEDCISLLVGPQSIDVDNLLESDFALCRLLPVQELAGLLLDDRLILKTILTNYEGRRFA